jgi:hypothetical protein
MTRQRFLDPTRGPLLGVLLLLLAVPARGQGPDMDGARAAFAEGKRLFEEQRPAEAAGAFRRAWRLNPSWKLFYNIGQCEAAARRHGLALEAFERYLAEGGDEIDDARRDEVLAEVERLRKMVGTVVVTAPDGAAVFVDGVERGTAPLSGKLPVSAGVEHTAWIVVDGERGPERRFKVMGSDTMGIDLREEAGPAPAPAAEAEDTAPPAGGAGPSREPSSGLRVGGWVLAGVGAAMLITGGITGGMALNLDEDLYESCPDEHCPATADYRDKIDRLDRLSVVTDVMLFAGGAIAATGAVLLILDATRDEEPSAVSLIPSAGPGFAGAALRGRF